MKAGLSAWCYAVLLALTLSNVAYAAIDTYEFADETQRTRFRDLTQALRCPKCQNQDIADSDAPIAADLRKEIFRMLGEGQSDAQIIDFMVARYGDFVRYKPPLNSRTSVLWLGPGVLLVGGAVAIFCTVRRRRAVGQRPTAELSAAERQRLTALLDKDDSA